MPALLSSLEALLRAAEDFPLDRGVGAASTRSLLSAASGGSAALAALEAERSRLAATLRRLVDAVEGGASESACGLTIASSLAAGDAAPTVAWLERAREAAESALDEARGTSAGQQVAALQNTLAAAAAAPGGSWRGAGPAGAATRRRAPPAQAASVWAKPQLRFDDLPENSRERAWVPREPPPAALPAEAVPYTSAQLLPPATAPAPFAPLATTPCAFIDKPSELDALMSYLTSGKVPPLLDAAAERFAAADAYAAGRLLAPTQSVGERERAAAAASADSSLGQSSEADAGAVVAAAVDAVATVPITELAIDLEAHSLRSFQGFTCLIQLSTRTHDFLVDALTLRPHLHALNLVTQDARVVKVLHGCDSDVLWLQRDFGVYLVNVFDTGQAARALALPSAGLAHLLQRYAGVNADKQYQTADWRERPLPAEMLRYAREDTHYLLGIYDRLRQDLVAHAPAGGDNPIATVLERSHARACARYEKDHFDAAGYRELMRKLGMTGSTGPLFQPAPDAVAADDNSGVDDESARPQSPRSRVFAALYDWRDATAREEDESLGYVLPNRLLARLAEVRPASIDALSRTCNPITPALSANGNEVVALIASAVADAARERAAAAATAAAAVAASTVQLAPAPAPAPAHAPAPAPANKRARADEVAASAAATKDRTDDRTSLAPIGAGDGAIKRSRLLDDLAASGLLAVPPPALLVPVPPPPPTAPAQQAPSVMSAAAANRLSMWGDDDDDVEVANGSASDAAASAAAAAVRSVISQRSLNDLIGISALLAQSAVAVSQAPAAPAAAQLPSEDTSAPAHVLAPVSTPALVPMPIPAPAPAPSVASEQHIMSLMERHGRGSSAQPARPASAAKAAAAAAASSPMATPAVSIAELEGAAARETALRKALEMAAGVTGLRATVESAAAAAARSAAPTRAGKMEARTGKRPAGAKVKVPRARVK